MALASTVLAACGGSDPQQSGGGIGNNMPPVIEGTPSTTLVAGSAYTFTPKAVDPNGDKLTFMATGVPSWASFDSATGTLSGTPTEANVGMSGMITIGVSDSKTETDLPSFRIDVNSATTVPPAVNHAPTISGTPPTTATVGKAYSFMPVGDDADNDTLTFSIDNKPSWATFTPATGQLTGTPASTDVGTTNNIVIHVSDGQATAALPAFNLQVVSTAPANRPPTITGTPAATVAAGSAYSFRPVASDPDGDTLQFSIQGQPSWASFSATTGRLSGTPTSANVGTSGRITITVTDGTLSASLASFTIQVTATATNHPPTISGTPGTTVVAGSAYSFQPSAADSDGNTLTFSISNMPAWASFNTATGRLSGTPAAADVGSYGNIIISVSDGTASVSLAAFTIVVAQNATGTATLSWTAPTTNTDGTALTDLTSYRIAYGHAANSLDQSTTVSVGVSTYTVNNLASGDWFFGVFAVNSSGVESAVSNIGTKTIP